MKSRLLNTLYFVLLLSGFAVSTVSAQTERSTIVLFGDSTTVGFNANFRDREANGTTERGCPTIYLKNILLNEPQRDESEDCPTTIYPSPIIDADNGTRNAVVVNWGIGGSSTERGVARINSNLNRTKRDHPADKFYVLIVYGTNDFGFQISASMTNFNHQVMIGLAKNAGYIPVIGTLTPRDDRDVTPYNDEIVSAARDSGVPVVDLFARFIAQPGGWRTIVQQEVGVNTGKLIRFHPTDQGYLIIAETWFDRFLRGAIQRGPDVDPEPMIPEFNIAPILDILMDD